MEQRGNLSEIFDSVQGEGLLVGFRQIFLRLAGCNLMCAFCDTPEARKPVSTCRVEKKPCSGEYEYLPNTLSVRDVLDVVEEMRTAEHHSIAVTGGEPLLQDDFLSVLLEELKSRSIRIFLETNSTLPEALVRVSRFVDTVSADIKISSCSGGDNRFDVNDEFFRSCQSPHLFAKIVVTEGAEKEEFLSAVEITRKSGKVESVVIQPAINRSGEVDISPGVLLDLQKSALKIHQNVRIIPPIQRILRVP
ncbi:MAG: 7-carboxy-7-deazaguanine synthase QueE [Actinomycetota bacterium]|nr:7-carboxy-7-deazaguanine synthase QueE [Actinomycetota bacterium]